MAEATIVFPIPVLTMAAPEPPQGIKRTHETAFSNENSAAQSVVLEETPLQAVQVDVSLAVCIEASGSSFSLNWTWTASILGSAVALEQHSEVVRDDVDLDVLCLAPLHNIVEALIRIRHSKFDIKTIANAPVPELKTKRRRSSTIDGYFVGVEYAPFADRQNKVHSKCLDSEKENEKDKERENDQEKESMNNLKRNHIFENYFSCAIRVRDEAVYNALTSSPTFSHQDGIGNIINKLKSLNCSFHLESEKDAKQVMAKDCEKQANGNKKIRLKQEKAKSLLGDFFTHRVKQNDEFERFIDAWRAEKTYSFELYVSAPVVGQAEDGSRLPLFPKIEGLAVCWDPSSLFFVILKGLKPKDEENRWKVLSEVLQEPNTTKVCFRVKEQLRHFLRQGIEISKGLWDVQIAAWVLDSEKNKYNDIDFMYAQTSKDDREVPKGISPVQRVFLNAHRIFHVYQKLSMDFQTKPAQQFILDKIEFPLLLILAKLEHHGIGFKFDIFKYHKELLMGKLNVLDERAYLLAGKQFNLSSPAEISAVLFEDMKIPYPTTTADGEAVPKIALNKRNSYSTKAEIIQQIDHPIGAIILEHRKLSHTVTTYIDNLPKFAQWSDEMNMFRIHSDCLQTAVPTGRLAFIDPNLQAITHSFDFVPASKRQIEAANELSQRLGSPSPVGPVTINIRDGFIAQEGFLLMSFDYAQIELRLIAHFCGDRMLMTAFQEANCDIFKTIASEWHQKPIAEISTQERTQTKQICYGLIYGMGYKALAAELKIKEDEARAMTASFRDRFSGIPRFLQWAVTDCKTSGYVQTVLGRRRYLSNIYSSEFRLRSQAERQAVNTICQGSAADISKKAMVEIDEYFRAVKLKTRLLLQIHDELLFEVPLVEVDLIKASIPRLMSSAVELKVPLPVHISIGRTWGSLVEEKT